MNLPPDIEVDYGECGPEDFDRFGTRQERVVTERLPWRRRVLRMIDVNGMFRKHNLVIVGARRNRFTELYTLTVNDRVLEIKYHVVGERISITLDDQEIYTEKTKIVSRDDGRYRETVSTKSGDYLQWREMSRLHAEAIKENVRFDMEQRRKTIRGNSTVKQE